MLKKITEKLKAAKLSGWQLHWSHKTSHQSFLAKDQLECRRQTETESCLITVFIKKPVEKLGSSSFKITPANIGGFDKDLETARFAAELVSNQFFELPENPKKLPNVDINDIAVKASALEKCEDRLRSAAAKEKNIRISAAELFLDKIERRLMNHKGLDVSEEETHLHNELILLAKTGAKENEYINRYTRRFLKDFDLEGELAQSAQFARDATQAGLPKTGKFPVLLSEEPLDQLFNPLIARASARLKYNKMMNVDVGQSVIEKGTVKGDSVTLWSNGLIDRAGGSSRFDSYGIPTNRTCLIEKNILKTYLADQRYGQYLNVPITGEMGNTEVEAGTLAFKKMLDPTSVKGKIIYHLQAFSAFEPNAITGAFSAEIRAGYEISSKGVRPIKGGSVSGVLQRDLLDCHLAKERVQRERSLVPQGILFSNLTIAGE